MSQTTHEPSACPRPADPASGDFSWGVSGDGGDKTHPKYTAFSIAHLQHIVIPSGEPAAHAQAELFLKRVAGISIGVSIKKMIFTITPSPALDYTFWQNQIKLGSVHRAEKSSTAAGGKGINVARALKALGRHAKVMAPLGGSSGEHIQRLLAKEFHEVYLLHVNTETRTNFTVVDESKNNSTVFNQRGGAISRPEWQKFWSLAKDHVEPEGVACICGSFPNAVDFNEPLKVASYLKSKGIKIWLDTSGEPLRKLAKIGPHGIKINHRELEEYWGHEISRQEIWFYADKLRSVAASSIVIITSGSSAAIYSSDNSRLSAKIPKVKTVNTLGSGDAFLAGVISAEVSTNDEAQILASGVAAGTASVVSTVPGGMSYANWTIFKKRVEIERNVS